MKSVSPADLAQWLADGNRTRPVLLDVREPWEYEICRIDGAELVPMRSIPEKLHALDKDRPIVCICHHGGRSANVALYLARHGRADVYNLTGGVDAWARQVDPAMATY